MPVWLRRSLLPTLILGAMLITLAGLAWLQYGWSAQVGEALQQRMRAGLAASVQHFQLAFQEDLSNLCGAFEVGTAFSSAEMQDLLAANARDWTRTGLPRELVANLYIVRDDPRGDWLLEALDPATSSYAPKPWPASWQDVAEELSANANDLDRATPRQWHRRPWTLMPGRLLLYRAVAAETADAGLNDQLGYRLLGYVVIELDRSYFEGHYLPQLVDRHFRNSADPDYRVAIINAGERAATLYDSQPGAGTLQASPADETVDLLSIANEGNREGKRRAFNIREASDSAVLQLEARHRSGSLDAAVTKLRRRNLAVSFGVLLVLCAGMAFLAMTAQRAQQLARLQVDFVAGFSHELRTPVAAVCMMAENMADGVVNTEQQVRQYGNLIQAQGRRLRTMVEEILSFAANQQRRPKLDLRPVRLGEVMACALSDEYPLIEASGIVVEEELSADLPLILADSTALRTCIGNLLSNAVKYGKTGGWIGISAEVSQRDRSAEVRLTVQDRGPGIDPSDSRHIFEPFYRSAKAREAQTPGAGLGLSLVRQMMEAMGGRVTVQTKPGSGSAFTLHLAVAASEVKQT